MTTTFDAQSHILELEASLRRAETISQINAALCRAASEQDILSAVADLAEQHHVYMSCLAYADTEPDGSVNMAKVVAIQSGDGNAVPLSALPTTDYPLDSNPILRVALENADEPLFVEDIFTDPRAEGGTTREVFQQSGSVATIILWFKAGGTWQGVMTFSWTQVQPFDDELRAIFKAIQPVAAAVVANRRSVYNLEQVVMERTAALRESETRFRTQMEQSPFSTQIFRPDGSLLSSNQAFCTLWGASQAEVEYLIEHYNILQDQQLEVTGLMPFIKSAFAGNYAETPPILYDPHQTGVASHMDLKAKWVVAYVWPVKDKDGNLQQVVLMHQDITERKQADAEREQLQQQVIDAQRQALQELSTPIIPLMDGIIVMPLIGAIDTLRSRDIMRALLNGISDYKAKIAILDITGVPIVDSGVADHLNRTIQAARLKGAQTIVTGISDAVAEAIVDLGIDWENIETLQNLQTGLMIALDSLGFKLSQRQSNGKTD